MARRLSAAVVMATTLVPAICTMFFFQLLQVVSCFDATLCAGADSTGRCSPDPFPTGTAVIQDLILGDFSERSFHAGNVTGCFSSSDYRDQYSNLIVAHASFTCDGAPSEACRDCFQRGLDRMEQGCEARAGGTVWLDNCCFRYETAYDIC
ncbi:unnamed protein product [Linum trigynum]|uniref:Gnk2-homologous domain-containing protein n=1 Tax=Linum trigynum TaxID=586398 RepID=A0AAV2GFM4_9ROSI